MRLENWLKTNGMTVMQLAEKLSKPRAYVYRFLRTENNPDKEVSIPPKEIMRELYVLSDGEVQPNAFYDLPKLKPKRAKKSN